VEAEGTDAVKMLGLRADSNFTLATILWGNVATNVLLTLLSESVLAGVGAFVFSTVNAILSGPSHQLRNSAVGFGTANSIT
jgi:metal transporter CNNM